MKNDHQKKEGHTGFRNKKMFCFHCGQSEELNLPKPVSEMVTILNVFEKKHVDCEKKWIEPIPHPIGKTELENLIWWIKNGEHGISSKTIVKCISSLETMLNDTFVDFIDLKSGHPHDPADFNRCYKLVVAVPQFRAKLSRMKFNGQPWVNIVDHWDELTEMLLQKDEKMFEFMKSIGC